MTRKHARTRGGGLLAGLAKLFERSDIDGLLDDDDLRDDEEPDYEPGNHGPIKIEDWIGSLYGVLAAHSRQIEKRAKKLCCTRICTTTSRFNVSVTLIRKSPRPVRSNAN